MRRGSSSEPSNGTRTSRARAVLRRIRGWRSPTRRASQRPGWFGVASRWSCGTPRVGGAKLRSAPVDPLFFRLGPRHRVSGHQMTDIGPGPDPGPRSGPMTAADVTLSPARHHRIRRPLTHGQSAPRRTRRSAPTARVANRRDRRTPSRPWVSDRRWHRLPLGEGNPAAAVGGRVSQGCPGESQPAAVHGVSLSTVTGHDHIASSSSRGGGHNRTHARGSSVPARPGSPWVGPTTSHSSPRRKVTSTDDQGPVTCAPFG